MSIASAAPATTLALLLALARPAVSQAPAPAPASTEAGPRVEFRVTSGAYVPTGAQRRVLKDAHATAAQLAWVIRPAVALTGTLGWARTRDLAGADTPKLDIFSGDVGVELRSAPRAASRTVTFRPFAGLGAGVRSYNSRMRNVESANTLAAYGAVGGEIGRGRVGLRLEVRDYVAGANSFAGERGSGARNDVVIMAGLRFNRR